LASLGTPANFNGFRVFASLLHRRRSTEVNQTLHGVWPSSALVHYRGLYTFWELLPFNGILPGANFTLPPRHAFSYIGSVTARHSSTTYASVNFAAWYKELNYGIFAALHFQQRAPPIFRGRPSCWVQAHILVYF